MEPTPPIRKAYPSDLRDGEWAILEPLVPAVKPGGRPARHSRREIVNAILYVVRGGNQWRAMPHDLPPGQKAFFYFPHWRNDGTGGQFHTALRQQMGWTLEVVKRADLQRRGTFAVQPHRWIVERTFSWWGGLRRLAKDYEYQVESSEALIYVGMSHLLLRRLSRRAQPLPSPAG